MEYISLDPPETPDDWEGRTHRMCRKCHPTPDGKHYFCMEYEEYFPAEELDDEGCGRHTWK